MLRTALEHLLRLGENGAGRTGFGERDMGASELEPDLDGEPGKAVVEQRAQAVSAGQSPRGHPSYRPSWIATRAVAT